jgi:hypothetical protein
MFCIYLEESTDRAASKPNADRDAPLGTAAEISQMVRRQVGAKWNRLSEQDLSALKDRDDLVRQVVSKYGIEKSLAQRDVDSFLQDRQI